MELMDSSEEFVKNHTKKDLDSTSLEVMQYVVMALFLTLGDIAKERLPQILSELIIFAEDKSVIDMAHEYLNNYQEDDILKYSSACVTRSLTFKNDGTFVEEKRNLLISLSADIDYFQIISNIIHEFIHLLRFGGVQQDGHKYTIKDGISVAYFDADTQILHREHQNMEDGVVQKYTNRAIQNLYKLLQSESISSEVYNRFIDGYKKCEFADYLLEVSMIETLCNDPRFQELIDYSFIEQDNPSQVVQYFNSVMNSSNAFIQLGNLASSINSKALGNKDIMGDYQKISYLISTFLRRCKGYK